MGAWNLMGAERAKILGGNVVQLLDQNHEGAPVSALFVFKHSPAPRQRGP
jgi:hypothetical protein